MMVPADQNNSLFDQASSAQNTPLWLYDMQVAMVIKATWSFTVNLSQKAAHWASLLIGTAVNLETYNLPDKMRVPDKSFLRVNFNSGVTVAYLMCDANDCKQTVLGL